MVEIPTIYESMTSAEKEVADFLKSKGLFWEFEYPLYLMDDKFRPRIWTPDFFIPDLGVYIEVCGNPNNDYAFRRKVYKLEDALVIFVETYKETWKFFLTKRLQEIHEKRSEIMKRVH
ncbi:MAG: hypothetical protein LUQ65_04850 [Candidatus Helarchaeota archaeon]|nr:hypothetical protein [Candidatus Helarchaeota archaeon]